MLDIVLYQPEIPPNTGNIIRLCANTGYNLHLIKPLGFDLNDKQLRRAGLDYHEFADLHVHDNLAAFTQAQQPARLLAFTTKAKNRYTDIQYQAGDALIFGPETRGLPADFLSGLPDQQRLRLPMLPDSRSLNLSNTVAIVVYESWRQANFKGG